MKFDFTKGSIFVLSGPSGVGKSTIIKELIEKFPTLKKPIAFATRPMREGEVNGKDYHFINKVQFAEMEKKGDFLVILEFNNNFYGIKQYDVKKLVDNGDDIIFDFNPEPAAKIKKLFPDARLIFIMPDKARTLTKRLGERNSKSEEIFARLQMSKEMLYASQYDHTVINHHGELPETVKELCRIVAQEKLTRGLRATLINDISFDLFRIRTYLFLAILRKNFPQFYEQRFSRPMQKILFFSAEDLSAESPKIGDALARHAALENSC